MFGSPAFGRILKKTRCIMRKIISKPKPEKKQKKGKKSLKRVSSRGALIKKAHALLRDVVLERDKGCVCPAPEKGHSTIRQAGHLIKSTKGAVRFDLYNVSEQCSGCNGRHERFDYYYTNWFVQTFGQAEYDRLCQDANKEGLKNYEIEEIIEQLTLIHNRQLEDKNFLPRFTQQEILSGAWVSIWDRDKSIIEVSIFKVGQE